MDGCSLLVVFNPPAFGCLSGCCVGMGMGMGMGVGVGVGVGCQLVNLVFLLQLFLALGSRVRFRFQVSRLLAKKPVRRSIISSQPKTTERHVVP